MQDYWFLDAESGLVRYAGQFVDYDECDRALDRNGEVSVWIFCGKPQIEQPYNFRDKSRVTIEVSGGVAEVTECPASVEVDIIDHDNEEVR